MLHAVTDDMPMTFTSRSTFGIDGVPNSQQTKTHIGMLPGRATKMFERRFLLAPFRQTKRRSRKLSARLCWRHKKTSASKVGRIQQSMVLLQLCLSPFHTPDLNTLR